MLRPVAEVDNPQERMEFALFCITCSRKGGHDGVVRLGAVEIDQGDRLVIVDGTGVRTAAKLPGPEQRFSTLAVNTFCADGHAFRILFQPEQDGPMLVTAEPFHVGVPPL